jgi:DNA polymerase-4
MDRLIAHIDMDAFYASVELLRYPELRGRAVVIGGGRDSQPKKRADGSHEFSSLRHYTGRGVVTTSTYEARKLGVFSAMGMMKSALLAPDAILLPVDFDEYRKYSRLFKAAVREIAPVIEDRGIDEIYVDLSNEPGVHDDAGRAIGGAIKAAVHERTGLTCSIGITPNKLLSKLASELDKPDGLTLLGHADVPARIWPLAARKVNGIGPKSAGRLETYGIRTIGDLARTEHAFLVETFGRAHGQWMHDAAHGHDARPVVTHSEPQSISRETTFDRDLSATRDRERLSAIFTELCAGVGDDLQRKGYAGRTIGVKLRYDNFATVTRVHTIDEPTQAVDVIRRAAGECLKRVDLARRIRLIGVRVGGLAPTNGTREAREPEPDRATASLFD